MVYINYSAPSESGNAYRTGKDRARAGRAFHYRRDIIRKAYTTSRFIEFSDVIFFQERERERQRNRLLERRITITSSTLYIRSPRAVSLRNERDQSRSFGATTMSGLGTTDVRQLHSFELYNGSD